MGRRRRPHLPGCIFHLTARTLGRKHLFTEPLRTAAIEILADVAPLARVRVLAVAVMSNHLHLVAQQGEPPLSGLMQPLLRRLAHAIQRAHRTDGPVFWGPFAAQACFDPDYARNAVVYVHLNPIRAGVCDNPSEYPWSTHALYEGRSPGAVRDASGSRAGALLDRLVEPRWALPLFAAASDRSLTELRHDYRAFVAWRIRADRAAAAEAPAPEPPPLALRSHGAGVWSRDLSPLFHSPVLMTGVPDDVAYRRYAPDLCDVARATLARFEPGFCLDDVRGPSRGARRIQARHRVIEALSEAGFRNCDIARFLGLSSSAVSSVARSARARRLPHRRSMVE